MGDQHKRLVLQGGLKTFAHHIFRGGIHVTGRFVQDEYVGIVQQGAGKGDGLPLAAGEVHTPFPHLGAEARRVEPDEFRYAREPCRTAHQPLLHGGIVESDIVPDGAVEEDHVLRQVADAAPQIGCVQLADVHAAEAHVALVRRIQADEQPPDRGFARSHAPNDAYALAGPDVQRNVFQRGPPRAGIAEAHVVQIQQRVQRRGVDRGIFPVVFRGGVHQRVEGLERHA